MDIDELRQAIEKADKEVQRCKEGQERVARLYPPHGHGHGIRWERRLKEAQQFREKLEARLAKLEWAQKMGLDQTAQYYVLHLSDLHLGTQKDARRWAGQLADDLKLELGCSRLNAMIITGDVANVAVQEEYDAAEFFIKRVCEEFGIPAANLAIVPGNHDLNWALSEDGYTPVKRKKYQGILEEGSYIEESDALIQIRDDRAYEKRFAPFSAFFEKVTARHYPLSHEQQGMIHHFKDLDLLILGLNSAWLVDHHFKSRAAICPDALNTALDTIQQNPDYAPCLKFAIWHHPLVSPFEDRITDHGFMERLAQSGFCVCFHGHLHKTETGLFRYDLSPGGRKIEIVGAGTFGAPTKDWSPGYPLQYNLLEISQKQMTVRTRCRTEIYGAWKPHAIWSQGPGQDPRSSYTIDLPPRPSKIHKPHAPSEAETDNPPPTEIQTDKEMVLIPTGVFLYGDNKKPTTIESDFYIDIYPVTNSRFAKFIEAKGYTTDDHWSQEGLKWRNENKITTPEYWQDEQWNQPDHPVVGVSWYEANAYARWAGKALPTEIQWERAARGIDGRVFPWGDDFDTEKCNTKEASIGKTTQVTLYPNGVSPEGCYDMAGNIWEWTNSRHERGGFLLRGGSWFSGYSSARCVNRTWGAPGDRYFSFGFRCVRLMEHEDKTSQPERSNSKYKPRVFISYSRKDGEPFAADLRKRLQAAKIPIWQDRVEMEGGKDWWLQIIEALNKVEFMVLIMTPKAMESDIIRKEWRYARHKGVCVYPVKGVPDEKLAYDNLPRWIKSAHFYDLDHEWDKFINNLNTRCQEPRVPFMVDDLPKNFVQRPEQYNALLNKLLDLEREEPQAITTVIRGAGGFGKTTLAMALCHDERIQNAYDDGILWVTLGEEPGDITEKIKNLIETLSGKRPGFTDKETAAAHLSELLADRDILIVIDDVWDKSHIQPFLRGGPRCSRLITTRHLYTMPTESEENLLDAMQADEALSLIGHKLPTNETEKDALQYLAQRLWNWPLVLRLVNAFLIERVVNSDQALSDAIPYILKRLDKFGITAFDAHDTKERNQAVEATLSVSFKIVKEDEKQRFAELAVFPEDINIPLEAVEKLWSHTGFDKVDTENLCTRLFGYSLLSHLNLYARTIRLYGFFKEYLRTKYRALLPTIHQRLLDAYNVGKWADLPDSETYLWHHLAYHLANAGLMEELRNLLCDYEWVRSKIRISGIYALIADYDNLPGDKELFLIQSSLKRSAKPLERDPNQLPSYLIYHLKDQTSSYIQKLLRTISTDIEAFQVLEGHLNPVSSVAFSEDGKTALSGSQDNTLKLWDLSTGQVLKTLKGHSASVNAVAISPDDQTAVSGSGDGTLKVWDLSTGRVIRTLEGHGGLVNSVAISPDGQTAVSGSGDGALKVWDLSSGKALRIFEGHSASVNAVAISPDGQTAVSGSGDGTLKVWDLSTGRVIRTLEGHGGLVNSVAISSDGQTAVSGSGDGTLKVWDLSTGRVIHYTFEIVAGSFISIAFRKDTKVALASTNGINDIFVWHLDHEVFSHVRRVKNLEQLSVPYTIRIEVLPEVVMFGGRVTITINLEPYGEEPGTTTLEVPILESDLGIFIHVSPGFECVGDNAFSLPLEPAADGEMYQDRSSQYAQFHLFANDYIAEAQVVIEFITKSGLKNEILLPIRMQKALVIEHKTERTLLPPRPVPHPDILLEVQPKLDETGTKLTFNYLLDGPALTDGKYRAFQSKPLSKEYYQHFMCLLESIVRDGAKASQLEAYEYMAGFGQELAYQLCPLDLWRDITAREVQSLQILAPEGAWLPWELLHDGTQFLGERLIIGRWLRELSDLRTYEFAVGKIIIAHYADVGLPNAWRDLLKPHNGPAAELLPGGVLQTNKNIQELRGLHILCGGRQSNELDSNLPELRKFGDDTRSRPQDRQHDNLAVLGQSKLNLRRNRPLVSLGYLESGVPGLTDVERHWAAAFVSAGASAFVGPLWMVTPEVEAAFTRGFYDSLWAGYPLGIAFQLGKRLARAAAPESVGWMAYVLYGDPMARAYQPVKGDGYAVIEAVGRDTNEPVRPGQSVRFRLGLRRSPPVWHNNRLVEVTETLNFQNLTVRIVAKGLKASPPSPIRMNKIGEDYLGWVTFTVPEDTVSETEIVEFYFVDGEKMVHMDTLSIKISPLILDGR